MNYLNQVSLLYISFLSSRAYLNWILFLWSCFDFAIVFTQITVPNLLMVVTFCMNWMDCDTDELYMICLSSTYNYNYQVVQHG